MLEGSQRVELEPNKQRTTFSIACQMSSIPLERCLPPSHVRSRMLLEIQLEDGGQEEGI